MSVQEDDKIQIIQNNIKDNHLQSLPGKKQLVKDSENHEINSPTGQRNNQMELSLLRLQNYQLEMAK